jgi:hypothetical protein
LTARAASSTGTGNWPASRTGSGYQAIFVTPKGGAVSLKAHLADAAGNTTDQTTIGAYQFR